jgi:hypothetical protein
LETSGNCNSRNNICNIKLPNHITNGSNKLVTEQNENNNNFFIKKRELKDNSFTNNSIENKEQTILNNNLNLNREVEYKERILKLQRIVNDSPKLILEVSIILIN